MNNNLNINAKNKKNKTIYYVDVLLQKIKVKNNIWINEKWQALGVIPNKENKNSSNLSTLISNINNEPVYQYRRFILEFVYDELDSYYQNISSNNASIFIICRYDDKNTPIPFLVTLSYDEAAIYMETDEIVYASAIDIEIYQKIEKFVLKYYQPKKRKKRKLIKGSAGEHYKKLSTYE